MLPLVTRIGLPSFVSAMEYACLSRSELACRVVDVLSLVVATKKLAFSDSLSIAQLLQQYLTIISYRLYRSVYTIIVTFSMSAHKNLMIFYVLNDGLLNINNDNGIYFHGT